MSPLVSVIIIDYKKENPYLRETFAALTKQSYKKFEVLFLSDHQTSYKFDGLIHKHYKGKYTSPAKKRDDGAKIAKGEILAFLDDDAYPHSDWLKNLVASFSLSPNIIAVGGPGVNPPHIPLLEAASGWLSASPLGAGPYSYRFIPMVSRFVDDYPSMNLAVRKVTYNLVGGYDSHYWPGEDTKLCIDLVNTGGKILYDPKVLVYHHRRPLWLAHLRQNGQFGLHRGYFAKNLPKTSARISYFTPSALLLGWLYLLLATFFPNLKVEPVYQFGGLMTIIYGLLVTINAYWIYQQSSSTLHFAISLVSVPATHLWYGFQFLRGLLFTARLIR